MSERVEITLPSRIESVDKAAEEVAEFVRLHGYGDEAAYAVDMAVRESVANAVKHGNKLDESKNVELTLADSVDGLEVTVRDFGSGFSPDDVADPTDPENLLKACGRGILFMRAFMDEVEWELAAGGGVIVKMSKMKK